MSKITSGWILIALASFLFGVVAGWKKGKSEFEGPRIAAMNRKIQELEASNDYNWKKATKNPDKVGILIPMEVFKSGVIDECVTVSGLDGWTTQRVVFNATNPAVLEYLNNPTNSSKKLR